jgi:hypothetical protein
MNDPRAAADILLELVSELVDIYAGTHRDLEHKLLCQVASQRMTRISTQMNSQDIEVTLSH